MTIVVARLLFPFSLVFAAALWAKGYADVGEGFSAGATAGLGAIVQYIFLNHETAARRVGARWAWPCVSFGLIGVLAITFGPLVFGFPPVTHFPRPGREVISFGVAEVHTAMAFDLAIAVLVYGMFVGTFDRLFPYYRRDLS